MSLSRVAVLAAVAVTLGLTPAPATARPAPSQAASAAVPPKLIVTIVVDQFSANLFDQYRSRYSGGLRRMADQGLVSINGYQSHGLTETCPGHSTVLTGLHPAQTGIPANDWIDARTGKEVYCLAAPQNHLAHGRDDTDNGPVGPEQLRATTLGDWLKAASPDSKVVAVSGKDRGAINLAGHRGQAFWFTEGFGLTTYVEPGETAEAKLAPVTRFNADFNAWMAATPVAWDYRNADCRALAGDWTIRGQTFHSVLPPAGLKFDTSPLLDEQTLKAAEYLLDSQKLGQGAATDMLGVSLSATDRIGHMYGTQGPEMCEQMHRLDAALGEFLDKLAQVPGGVLVVLTADHGGSDFVERLHDHGYPQARRADTDAIKGVNAALKARLNLDADPLQSGGSGWMVADAQRRSLPDPLRTQVAEAAVEMLRALPDVAFAETRDRLLAEPLPDSRQPEMMTVRERMRLSTVAERSPDIQFAWAQNTTAGGRVGSTIAGHGTPWEYDRRVPILFWWPGATAEERFLPIRTVDIAPTLAHVIGVQTPRVEGRCIDLNGFAVADCPATEAAETTRGR
ncbi:alkaline phosphatase family protein [Brevundimonas sp. SORGH_AS_0993]|uniref:alkaline phosphatase family protein n=1 Tax=Brevundimonas sp. SORGH_AS_0993 TaxID=3041794 RepID=UPI00278B1971|nr:alkaline phosphatase family protein [Brevundimonas sp. SORGH_AS_0993]MDQ1152831.1 putative AlkP superfamily pyrophosphatase or phosphodiesterase [Brevundimonas sp. SORGH_AS_0993]